MGKQPYLKKPQDLEGLYRWREAALKCLPEYREAWAELVQCHGADVVRTALRELREPRGVFGSHGLSPVAHDLLDLSSRFFMERGPVDPDDEEDFGWRWGSETTFGGKAIRASTRPVLPGDTWVPALIDLSASKTLLAEEIARLREAAPLKRTRAKGRLDWQDELGWGTAFRLLRVQVVSKRSGADIGREVFADRLPTEDAQARLANELISCAKSAQADVKEEISRLRREIERHGDLPPTQDVLLQDSAYTQALGRRLDALGPFWMR